MNSIKRTALIKPGGAIFILAVVALWVAIVFVEMQHGPLDPIFLAATLPPLIIIVAVMILVIRKHTKSVKSGLPLKDEMSKRISYKSGYYTAMSAIWFLVAFMWYHMFMEELGLPAILARHIIIIVLIFMLIVFSALRWHFGRKGDI
jgi:TRAP-type uncharacterized transport system fused permease subunit